MLGFYPLETEWNSKFHNIEVKVKHSGLEVRHREVFYGLPELRLSAKDRTERALQAVTAPLQATGVTLMVRLAENPSRNAPLRFDLVIDPRQITLESHGSHMTGSLYLAFVQCTVAGKILAAKQEKGDLNLDEATYQKALMNGFALAREWALQPGAEQLRIGVCDGASDNVGSVTIPLFK
jgi:hypothetical protein